MPDLIIRVGKVDPKTRVAFRKTLDGKVILLDHPILDIVIDPAKLKISTFAKDTFGDHVYDSQDQMFKYLMKHGIIDYDAVRAGNVFNAMESKYLPAADNRDALDEVIMAIKNHIDEILPYFKAMEQYEEEYEQSLLNPDEEDSTELGEIPQKSTQGTLRPPYVRGQYSMYENKNRDLRK
jgi:hypothetical protein